MRIKEIVDLLIKHSLTIQDYLLLRFILESDIDSFTNYKEKFGPFYTLEGVEKLIKDKFLKTKTSSGVLSLGNLAVTSKFLINFKNILGNAVKGNTEEVEDWFEEWYNLFPRGIKSGGYMVRGDKRGCLNKLKKFTADYPEFNKDIIIEATKEYIEESRKNKYQFMMLAHYFISKNRVSSLAGYCELIEDRKNNPEEINKSERESLDDDGWDFLRDI